MKTTERIAIARVFVDLIKADKIIDAGEMEFWRIICAKYAITKEMEVQAQELSFADAISIIRDSHVPGLMLDLLRESKSMTVSDGFCAHPEALIMIALELLLNADYHCSVDAISIPKADFNIDMATALYIESEYDPQINDAITDRYRTIFKEFQLAGFHFVYLPHIISHYRETDPRLFRYILSFLAPRLSIEGIEAAYESLMGMTTSTFCKDLLCNKLGISALRNTFPALLIKIGNNYVGQEAYANYIRIEVDPDIEGLIQNFTDMFTDMLSSDVYVVNAAEESDSQFHFHGFYKQLLDIFLIRRNIRSTICIDPYKETIRFPQIDAKISGLHRRERALYALLLCHGPAGINFDAPASGSALLRYQERMKRLQRRYETIYEMFGGKAVSAPDLSVPEIRRPIFSCLRRALRNLPGLYNPLDYNVTKGVDGTFSVNVESGLVFVYQNGCDKPVPLHDSEMYQRWQAQ